MTRSGIVASNRGGPTALVGISGGRVPPDNPSPNPNQDRTLVTKEQRWRSACEGKRLPTVAELLVGCPFMGGSLQEDAREFSEYTLSRTRQDGPEAAALRIALREVAHVPIGMHFIAAANASRCAAQAGVTFDIDLERCALRFDLYATCVGYAQPALRVVAAALKYATKVEASSEDLIALASAAMGWLHFATNREPSSMDVSATIQHLHRTQVADIGQQFLSKVVGGVARASAACAEAADGAYPETPLREPHPLLGRALPCRRSSAHPRAPRDSSQPRGILFYGDPHGEWRPLLDAAVRDRPAGIVILGDINANRPLSTELAPLLTAGMWIRFIHGNHDADCRQWWTNSVDDMRDSWMHARTEDIGEILIAGLGGTFKRQIWWPKAMLGSPSYTTRLDYFLDRGRKPEQLAKVALQLAGTIFPEDREQLRGRRADILIAHETASCHRHGFEAVDDIAHDLQVRLVVTGHQHAAFVGKTRDGIPVRGLSRAQTWLLDALP